MNCRTRWRALLAAALAPLMLLPATGWAQADPYPSKPVTLVVPFGPGSLTDTLARIVGQRLSPALGQPVVVDNKPGAGGNIGAAHVAGAAKDGTTLLVGPASTNAINPSLYSNLKFDPQRDFTPITNLASVSNVLVVSPEVSARSVKELVQLLDTRKMSYGSGGAGGSQHLSGELFKSLTGKDMLHVPYKGMNPALQDLLAGRVDAMFCNMPVCLPHIRSGKLTPLAVTSGKRSALLPDVPTMQEAGIPNYVVEGWFGLFAPAGTPQAVIDRLNTEVVKILKDPATVQQLQGQGAEPDPGSPKEFAAFVGKEREKWAKVIRDARITLE
ncbi:tripartite tricarboxylate transporter substrate binding protein [Ramlibacter sp. AN1015]|uniref:Bug family tripartite tricarboxylate transporter substrate binding protein n=1 Tax=Ramlibacter sp. AN1015 TaxID=3133428 RepID=UPI0030C12F5D